MMIDNFDTPVSPETPQRPMFLTVLCVLTFIASGLGALVSLFTPLFAEQIIEFMKTAPNFDEEQMAEGIRVLQAGWGYYLIVAALSAVSLMGAIFMWKLKKVGFHMYALSNLLLLFIPTLMLSIQMSWFSVFTMACFILLYALNFKSLK